MVLQTEDLRIRESQQVISPTKLHQEVPISDRAAQTVYYARQQIQQILRGDDARLMLIAGPCSIHDPEAARDYAVHLKSLAVDLNEQLLIVMRVYFEKPRTTIGWKGLINDPGLDQSFRINDGLRVARRLLVDLNEMGLPAGTEFLDPISPQYYADLISWGAIGARTTESQVHRELASGLSCPIGFKNATDGGVQIAIDAIKSASHPHHFLGVTHQGQSAILATTGNPDCRIILRGGEDKPNYDARSIDAVAERLLAAGLKPQIVVDCSHANSGKAHTEQINVATDVGNQIAAGDSRIFAMMLESNLVAGRQDLVAGRSLLYGQSVTDACIGWDESEALIGALATQTAARRGKR